MSSRGLLRARRLPQRLLSELAYWRLVAHLRRQPQKRVSAMIRVKNEEEFLYPAVKSIAGDIDEIVLVDNLSTDRTPDIIEALRQEYPGKVSCHRYPHELRKRGEDNWRALQGEEPRGSPRLSATYYNWCLERCRRPYALKWDGDMIATPAFATAIERWRRSRDLVLLLRGVNVHPDRQHAVGPRTSDRRALTAGLSFATVPSWVVTMTHTYPEPRLFPCFLARYEMKAWTQVLTSPVLEGRGPARSVREVPDVAFLHLKFCKRDPYSDMSPDLERVVASNIAEGPPLSAEWRELLREAETTGGAGGAPASLRAPLDARGIR